jgi:hypothetical protein
VADRRIVERSAFMGGSVGTAYQPIAFLENRCVPI